MVTINENKKTKIVNESERYILVELSGISTDEKPTSYVEGEKTSYIDNGSVFIEMDTGTLYFFDYENQEWKEQ